MPEFHSLLQLRVALRLDDSEWNQLLLILGTPRSSSEIKKSIPEYATSRGLVLTGLRLSRGISQDRLADALGVSRRTLSRWEAGTSEMTFESMARLAKALELSECEEAELVAAGNQPGIEEFQLDTRKDCPDLRTLLGKPQTEVTYFEVLPIWKVAAVRAIHEYNWRQLAGVLGVRGMQALIYSPMVGHMKVWAAIQRNYWGRLDQNHVAYGCGLGLGDYANWCRIPTDDFEFAKKTVTKNVELVRKHWNCSVDGLGWIMMRTARQLAIVGDEVAAWRLVNENLRRQPDSFLEDFERYMWEASIYQALGNHGRVLDMAEKILLPRLNGLDDNVRLPALAATSAKKLGLTTLTDEWTHFACERLDEIRQGQSPKSFVDWAIGEVARIQSF